ncbi:MAG: TrmB family transcriptional regulator [Kurthia sp.]|nr:TrmB family transcriptional regulator [Candidatus Kurthia equi]
MQKIIELLKNTGYTQYESKAYIALLQNSDVTAYQISKDSGIPRARIYDVLTSLITKGIVSKNESTAKTTYKPLPVDVFLQKTTTAWEEDFRNLSQSLKELEVKTPREEKTVMVLHEEEAILSYCQTIIQSAKSKIILSMWNDMYDRLRPFLEARSDELAIHGITLHVEDVIPTVDTHRITYFTERPTSSRWFIVSVDSEKLVYGPSIDEQSTAFFTDDPVHIRLLEDYVWHDVLVNRLINRSDNHVEEWVKEQRATFFLDER